MDQINDFFCDVCNIHMHINCYDSHIKGKKHILKQEQFDRVHKSIYVNGVANFTPERLKKIFSKYGGVSHVVKPQNTFAFVQFIDNSSVEKALQDRIFVRGARFFTNKYTEKKNSQVKPGNLSAQTPTADTSQNELTDSQVGPREFLVVLANPSECPEGQSVFEWQVHQIISQVELPTDMYQRLNDVMNDLEEIFDPVLPGCRVFVFGSCATTLAFKDSDVDLFLQSVGNQPKDFVRKEAKVMYKSRNIKILAKISSARVPIVKFIHLTSGWHCDINAFSRMGVCNSRLIRFLISLDPRIRTLVMVVKFWAKVCEVTGSHQTLTTYSLVMLVMFYLQQLNPPILPPVVTLKQLANKKEFNHSWECSFCDEELTLRSASPVEENSSSLRELLCNFFHFYHTFDYNNVICPLLGRTIPESDFEDPNNLPSEMHSYKERLKTDPKIKFRTNVMLRMQDPFELCLNITRNVIDKSFFVFKQACKVSYDICQGSDEDSLLKSLFTINRNMLYIPDDNVSKFCINFKDSLIENTSSSLESKVVERYDLITKAILLVMKEVFKLHVEPNNLKISSKVKKSVSSQDVHTLNSFESCEDLAYVCNANAVVWNSRRKVGKLINHLNIFSSDFEKELFISEVLYEPKESKLFSFNLSISSFEQFKHNGNAVDVIIKYNISEGKTDRKNLDNFLRYNFKKLVNLALLFTIDQKNSSPEIEVKELLKKLFNIKEKLFPYLQASNKCKLEMRNAESPASERRVSENIRNVSTADSGNKYQKQAEPLIFECMKDSSFTDTKDQIMRSEPLVMHSTATQISMDKLLKPNNSDEMDGKKSVNEKLNNDSNDQLFGTLQNLEKPKNQSIFTCEEKNPFLASIEKVLLKAVAHETANDDYKTKQSNNQEVQTENEPENKSVELNDGMKDQGEVSSSFTSHASSSNSSFCEVKVKPIEQQRPKVYLERPHKFRNTSNHKEAQHNFHKLHLENIGRGYSRSRETGPYGQQIYPRRNFTAESTNDYQYCDELSDNTRANYFNKRHRYQ